MISGIPLRIRLSTLLPCLACAFALVGKAEETPARPNIVFILADDLGWNDVGWHRNDEFIEEDGHVTDLITEEAVRVIRDSGDEPFFLYVAHHSPHYPLNEPPKWIAPYDETIEALWRRHFAAAVTHLASARSSPRSRPRAKPTTRSSSSPPTTAASRPGMPLPTNTTDRYAAHTTLGDNEPLRGWKTDLYEGGIRVPALARWPGVIEAGSAVTVPTHITDWAPTLIRLAGGTVAEDWQLDGRDIAPVLFGEPDEETTDSLAGRTLYWKTRQASAIRQGDWKLIVSKDGDRIELFDLASDPHETTNLAKKKPGMVASLRTKLKEIAAADS